MGERERERDTKSSMYIKLYLHVRRSDWSLWNLEELVEQSEVANVYQFLKGV